MRHHQLTMILSIKGPAFQPQTAMVDPFITESIVVCSKHEATQSCVIGQLCCLQSKCYFLHNSKCVLLSVASH